jgi:hypothetical protein
MDGGMVTPGKVSDQNLHVAGEYLAVSQKSTVLIVRNGMKGPI